MTVTAVDIEWLGDYFTDDQISNTSLCGSKSCLLDAGRLLEAAAQQSVQPCDDFREFSMGNFIKYRALHDRYDRVGFLYDNLAVHYERLRKTLTAPVEADDSWVFKIVKNFFQKFVDASS